MASGSGGLFGLDFTALKAGFVSAVKEVQKFLNIGGDEVEQVGVYDSFSQAGSYPSSQNSSPRNSDSVFVGRANPDPERPSFVPPLDLSKIQPPFDQESSSSRLSLETEITSTTTRQNQVFVHLDNKPGSYDFLNEPEEHSVAMASLKQKFQNLFGETDSEKIANELGKIKLGFKQSKKIYQEAENQTLINSAFELLGEIANNPDAKIFKSPAIIEIADNVIEYYAPIREKELREAWFQNLKTSVGGHGFSTDRKSETENSKQLLEVREYFKGNRFNLARYEKLKAKSGNAQEPALSNIADDKFFAKLMSLSQETQVDFSVDEIETAYKIMQKEKKIKLVEEVKQYFAEIKIDNKNFEQRTAEILRIKSEFEESFKEKKGMIEFENNKEIIKEVFRNLNQIALNFNSDITHKIFTDEKDFEMLSIMTKLVISLDRNKRLKDLAPRVIEVGSTMAVNSDSVQLSAPKEDDPSVEVGMNKTQDATTKITRFRSSWLRNYSSGLPGTSGEVRDQAGLYGEFLSKITKEKEEPESQISLTERKGKLKESLKDYFFSFNPFLHRQKILEMKRSFPDPNHIGIKDDEMSKNITNAFQKVNKFIVQRDKKIDFSKEDMEIIEFSLDKAKDRDLAPQTRMQKPCQSKFMKKLSGENVGSDTEIVTM